MSDITLNNGKVGRIQVVPREIGAGFRTMVTLPSELQNTPSSYFKVMEKLFEAADPLPRGKMPDISLRWLPDEVPHQIETNLEPKQLLGALWISELITQEEMTRAYKALSLEPQNKFYAHPLESQGQFGLLGTSLF